MDKPVSALMQTQVTTVNMEASIASVEQTLDDKKLSCVPVVDADGKCFGVISAPDLVHFHRVRGNSLAERAWEVCTHTVVEAGPEISVRQAARLMLSNKVHHVVIVENESIVGMVSSLDLVEEGISHGIL